jgi:hypothetical protein
MIEATMGLQVLIIDDQVRQRIAEIVAFAMRSENVYRPYTTENAKVPGDDPRYVLSTGTHRIVFSITENADRIPFKHLSISVGTKGKYPNPDVVREIISLYGFTGGLEDCMVRTNEAERCVILAQVHQPVLS